MPNGAGGGGGGGIVGVGNSFTGPAEALEIIGDHAYAYSGKHQASTTAADHLKFTSGNYYWVGRLYLNGTTEGGSGSGEVTTAITTFNGADVSRLKVDSAVNNDGMATSTYNDLIIPPYTEVVVNVDSSATNSGRFSTLVMVGRIYRTRD